MTLTHGSLFSGIGGFDLGFERAGIRTIWQVEIDPYCRRVLGKHFPHALRFDDIRNCGRHNLPAVDILSGGFPCQDISNAGKRVGIDGERSGLWSEYARIIRELRPRYVVVENVAALLHRGMERVLGDLAACGYDAEWQSIRASDVGAPHRRERIWIVAYPHRSGVRQQPIFRAERDGAPRTEHDSENVSNPASDLRGAPRHEIFNPSHGPCADVANANGGRFAVQGEPSRIDRFAARGGEAVADAQRDGRQQGEVSHAVVPGLEGAEIGELAGSRDGRFNPNAAGSDWWAVEPDVGRVANGVPSRVDRLRGLGNAIVPQIAEWIGQQIVNE